MKMYAIEAPTAIQYHLASGIIPRDLRIVTPIVSVVFGKTYKTHFFVEFNDISCLDVTSCLAIAFEMIHNN